MAQAVADTLRRAKALIDTPEKWWNGHRAANTAICAGTAIARSEVANQRVARDAFERHIGNIVQSFNDMPGRTHAEVMEAFSRAIEEEENP